MKGCGLTVRVVLKLFSLSVREGAGIGGVAVKCIDIVEKVDSESMFLSNN